MSAKVKIPRQTMFCWRTWCWTGPEESLVDNKRVFKMPFDGELTASSSASLQTAVILLELKHRWEELQLYDPPHMIDRVPVQHSPGGGVKTVPSLNVVKPECGNGLCHCAEFFFSQNMFHNIIIIIKKNPHKVCRTAPVVFLLSPTLTSHCSKMSPFSDVK